MRDEFTEKTKHVIQNRAGNRCSNPECRVLTSGPNAHPEKATKTGVAAHITGASPGGPRYNPNLTSEQRRSVLNGIWVCRRCADFIDTDYMNYPVSLLQNWKEEAEKEADEQNKGKNAELPSPNSSDDDFEEGWACPYCGTTVPFDRSVCLGCNAEVVPGLTRFEREEMAKTGLLVGGGIPMLLFGLLPNWLNSQFSLEIKPFFGVGMYILVLLAIPALVGSFITVRVAEKRRLSEPPRFFRSTYRW